MGPAQVFVGERLRLAEVDRKPEVRGNSVKEAWNPAAPHLVIGLHDADTSFPDRNLDDGIDAWHLRRSIIVVGEMGVDAGNRIGAPTVEQPIDPCRARTGTQGNTLNGRQPNDSVRRPHDSIR